jgi:hypothetical protein
LRSKGGESVTKVICNNKKCIYNKDGICISKEIGLEEIVQSNVPMAVFICSDCRERKIGHEDQN